MDSWKIEITNGGTAVNLPDPNLCKPGDMIEVHYGKEKTAKFSCMMRCEDGEVFNRWVQH